MSKQAIANLLVKDENNYSSAISNRRWYVYSSAIIIVTIIAQLTQQFLHQL